MYRFRQVATVALMGVALGVGGCKPGQGQGQGGGPGTGPGGARGAPVMQVLAVQASRESVEESLSLVGSFAANEQVEIKSESEGFVKDVLFQEGQDVAKGALLVTLDDTKLQASLDEAEASLKLSRQTFERAQELLRVRLISQQEYDQAASRLAVDEATVALRQRQMKDARVVAPFEGVVGARQVSPGQLVNRATTLTWLVDLDPVKVEFNLPERFLSRVALGQTIEVSVAAWPGRSFAGKVFFIAPFVEPDTRTVLLKAELPNSERLLKPGMFASLDLTLRVRENAVVIPEVALAQILDGDRAMVAVVGAEDTVVMQPVRVGLRLPGRVEILEGLAGGEKVITEGLQKIAPGMKVRLGAPAPAPAPAPPPASAPSSAGAGKSA